MNFRVNLVDDRIPYKISFSEIPGTIKCYFSQNFPAGELSNGCTKQTSLFSVPSKNFKVDFLDEGNPISMNVKITDSAGFMNSTLIVSGDLKSREERKSKAAGSYSENLKGLLSGKF